MDIGSEERSRQSWFVSLYHLPTKCRRHGKHKTNNISCSHDFEHAVQNEAWKEFLACHTHMMPVASTDTKNQGKSRHEGVKILGDPVSLQGNLEDMQKLFHLLTVRRIMMILPILFPVI